MEDPSNVGEARRFALNLCTELNFDETRKGRVGIIVNELGNNLIRYAQKGELVLRGLDNEKKFGVEILSIDRGPGLDEDLVMRDGFTTGSTPGTGLGSVRRQSDEFDLFSNGPTGTVMMSRVYATEASAKMKVRFDIGAISVPLKNETLCGDSWACRVTSDGLETLVVDGLGHGPSANKAAMEAITAFESTPDTPPEQLLQIIHNRLRSTRGGAVFLLNAGASKINYVGVGNIRALVQYPLTTKSLISHNGTAGLQIRHGNSSSQAWEKPGQLIFHSDGLNTRWDLIAYPGIFFRHPSLIAAVLYRDHNRGNDDTTVVVIRSLQ